jgi:hypothetical protein
MYLISEIFNKSYKSFDFLKEQEANSNINDLAHKYNGQGFDYFYYSGYITRFLWENDDIRNSHVTDLSFLPRFNNIKAFWFGGINTDLKYIENLDIEKLEYLSIYFDSKYTAQLKKAIKKDLSFVTKFINLKFLAICPDPTSPITIKNVLFNKLLSLNIDNYDISNVDFSCFPNLEYLSVGSIDNDTDKCNFEQLKNLRALNISGFNKANSIDFLKQLENLEILNISGFTSVTKFPDLSKLKKLKWLFFNCKGIKNFESLVTAPNLEKIKISNRISKDFDIELFRPITESRSLKEFGYSYDYQTKAEEKKLIEMFGDRYNPMSKKQIFLLEGGGHHIIE